MANKIRLLTTYIIFIISIITIVSRIFYIKLSFNTKKQILSENILRGAIFDRNNNVLSVNSISFSISANPKKFDVNEIPDKINKLARYLKMSKRNLLKKIKLNKNFNWIKRKISIDDANHIKKLKMKGVTVRKEYKRIYPVKYRASHLLGFTDISGIGIEGLEYTFNKVLNGFIDKKFNIKKSRKFGLNVKLTIDNRIQDISRKTLKEGVKKYKANSGTIIILNSSTGEILSLVNYPDYDNNQFSKYSRELYRNNAVVNYYETGSVIKPIIISIALEEKIISKNQLIYCPKSIKIQDREIKRSVKKDYASIEDIIKKSCNVGIMQIAKLIPIKIFHKYLSRYGFGKKTNVELSGEGKGILKPLKQITEESKLNMSFGYEIGTTALQMVSIISVIANNGILVRPKILHSITDITGNIITNNKNNKKIKIISKNTSITLLKMLESVLKKGGTATLAYTKKLKLKGKTGTTEIFNKEIGKYDKETVHTSFVAIVPNGKTNLVFLVLANQPIVSQSSGRVSVPLFKDLLDNLMENGLIPYVE